MSNGIGRLRTMGIAAQPTFGTQATSATFVLPLTNSPQLTATVNKIMNEAALGSAYAINEMEKTTRFTNAPLEFKVDEDQFPLMFKQRFSISSVTASGETAVYTHTMSFQNATNTWYTLFLQDDQRQDYIVKNALFETHEMGFDNDFVRLTSSIVGAYPTQSSVTNAITQPKEFVGRMATYLDNTTGSAVAAEDVLALTGTFNFGINGDDTRFGLGSAEIQALNLTADRYMLNVSKLKPDVSRYDDNENLTAKVAQVNIESTDREVAGSVAATNPKITFDIPRGKYENYTEEPDLDELVKENFDLRMLKPAGVSDTPMKITVINATASY